MTEQSPDENIQRRLKALRSWDWYNRKVAVQSLNEQQLKDDRIISALKTLTEKDSIDTVREAARQALLGKQPESISATEGNNNRAAAEKLNSPKSNKRPATRKALEFLLGAVIAIVINSLMIGLAVWIAYTNTSSGAGAALAMIGLCPPVLLVLNLVIIAISGGRRNRWFALGTALPLVAGLILTIAFFLRLPVVEVILKLINR
jgi:hypothetical protein